jgi:hypothetical protein
MSGTPGRPSLRDRRRWGRSRRRLDSFRAPALGSGLIVLVLLLAGCGGSSGPERGDSSASAVAPLVLSGPDTHLTVTIPAGWHQVIDSADPIIPEMVSPVTCAGSKEVACALGLARVATLAAASAQAAVQAVRRAVDSGAGVRPGAAISQGPSRVAGQEGYLLRFGFSNGGASLTSAIAAVASGTGEFAVVLVWVSGKPGAPGSGVIGQIIASAALTSGQSWPDPAQGAG